MKPMFNPSLMCMDLLNIREQTAILNERCDLYHVDIMDGHFVKNITLSPDFVRAFSKIAMRPIECHLMLTDPDVYIAPLAEAGAGYICPHAETITNDAFRILNKIEALGCKKGVAVSPSTPLSSLQHYLGRVDKLTIMSVDPGFAGQPFIPEMLEKIAQAKRMREENGWHYKIMIDGSCNKRTFRRLYEAGADVFVLGSSGLFSLDVDLASACDTMKRQFEEETGLKQ